MVVMLVVAAATPWLLGARRVTGTGCGGTTLGRFLQAENLDGVRTANLIGDATRTSTLTRARVATLDAQTIRWRGDPNSYVDVFFAEMDDEGIEYAPMVRYDWPGGIFGERSSQLSPRSTSPRSTRVLSEWDEGEELLGYGEADPLFPVLDFGGACNRDPLDADVPGRIGYLGPVREDPFPGFPPPFGDAP